MDENFVCVMEDPILKEKYNEAKARRDAARLTGGVTSASGGGGGDVSTNDTLRNGEK